MCTASELGNGIKPPFSACATTSEYIDETIAKSADEEASLTFGSATPWIVLLTIVKSVALPTHASANTRGPLHVRFANSAWTAHIYERLVLAYQASLQGQVCARPKASRSVQICKKRQIKAVYRVISSVFRLVGLPHRSTHPCCTPDKSAARRQSACTRIFPAQHVRVIDMVIHALSIPPPPTTMTDIRRTSGCRSCGSTFRRTERPAESAPSTHCTAAAGARSGSTARRPHRPPSRPRASPPLRAGGGSSRSTSRSSVRRCPPARKGEMTSKSASFPFGKRQSRFEKPE